MNNNESREYSDEFVSILADKLNRYNPSVVERPLCKLLLRENVMGKPKKACDLTEEVLMELVVGEKCSDIVIATLFDMNRCAVKALREKCNLTDNTIDIAHIKYLANKMAAQLENEMGDAAFKE